MSVSTGTVGSTTVRQSNLAKSNVGSKSNVSGTFDQALESCNNDDAEEEETRIYLPLPPQFAHTTTRKVAELGPQLGASSYAPGMLHRLALHGERDEVSALLQMKEGEEYGIHSATPLADVNMYDNQGMTALHCAAVSGMSSTCLVLLEERADPNIGKQNSGYTALHFACENGHLEVVKLLVKHRADINLQARMKGLGGQDRGDLSTPLHRACLSGRLDVISAMVEGLPSKGAIMTADVNKTDGAGQTPLHKAAEKCPDKCIMTLLNKSADIEARNTLGETPLHCAVYARNLSAVEVLLNRNADAKAESLNKEVPIRICASEETRLKKMAQRRKLNEEERMIQSNMQVIMELLVEKGAYIKKTDRLLELGIPEHLRRKNTENEMRAVNKAAGFGALTDEEVKRAQAVIAMRQQKEEEERRKLAEQQR